MHDCKQENAINRIETKIDKQSDTLSDIKVCLEKNTNSLEEHMRRTQLLEDALKPIANVHAWATVTIKIITVLGVIISIITAISKLL